MAIELECKISLTAEAAAQLRARLTAIGAKFHGEEFEQNWVFDRDGELLARRETLRVRVNNHRESGSLTHKRPLVATDDRYKSREEIETQVENAANVRAILQALGYAPSWYYEKRRQTWRDENFCIVLDTLPEIGIFVEIEAPDEAGLSAMLDRLHLDRAASKNLSYAEWWRQHCGTERGEPMRECKFAGV
ncbi:MAG: class IV adenylate cyclase [Planctomycetota bacterium]|jgi:predicted adenylyl cyclase CyaB|nr:class IV adenylate cyclase [Planctomycetota bacterium]